jgi:glycosyltransferase involved in cell wall biosynthesis
MTNQKTIWIINQYAGSSIHGMEYRHYYLAKEFVASGHKVVMISGSYSHLYKLEPTTNGTFTTEEIEGITYCWVKVPRYERSISLGRFKNMMAFAWNLRKLPLTDFPKPNAIIVSSPSLFPIVIARKWATMFKAKLLFEIRDIWPLTLQELSGLKKWHPVSILLSYFEKYGYKKADKVISLLPDAHLHFEKCGMPKSKFHYIPNGIFINNEELPAVDFVMDIPKDRFIMGYVGSMGRSNALEFYIEAINKLANHPEIVFVFIGKGAEKEALKNATSNKNVIWIDAIEKNMVQSALSQMDACYIGWHNIKLYEMGISANKIFDYMFAAKPIIHSNNASNDLVKLANCGLSIPAENPQAIADAILHLATLPSEERKKMGENGRKYVLENHTYGELANKYIKLF